jgi:hypothetical protein
MGYLIILAVPLFSFVKLPELLYLGNNTLYEKLSIISSIIYVLFKTIYGISLKDNIFNNIIVSPTFNP